MVYTTAVYCILLQKIEEDIQQQKSVRYSLREGKEALGDGGERGLVTGVTSWWGRASRSTRTKYLPAVRRKSLDARP